MSNFNIHVTPLVCQIRVFDEPNGYENRKPYKAILTITYLTPEVAYISGAHGIINKEIYAVIENMLKEQGVTKYFYERRGKFVTKYIQQDPTDPTM